MAKRREGDDLLTNFLPINRKFFAHPFWTEVRMFSKSEAWLDLIRSARFEESEARALMGGKMVRWSRGQMPASLRFLADRWHWSKNKVDDFLKLLEREGMVVRSVESGQTIISLCNYEVYNPGGQQKGQRKGQANAGQAYVPTLLPDTERDTGWDNEGTGGGQPRDESKNENNGKNGKEESGASAPVFTADEIAIFALFQQWIAKNAPNVARMKEPFTIQQFFQLRKKLPKAAVQDLLIKMHNWKPLLQKNLSAYWTLTNWSRKDFNDRETMTNGQGPSINEKLKAAGKESAGGEQA